MKERRDVKVLAAAAMAIALYATVLAQAQKPSEGVDKLSCYYRTLDCLIRAEAVGRTDWEATLSIVPAFDPEWSLSIARLADGKVAATVTRPTGYRIADRFAKGWQEGSTCECDRVHEYPVRRCRIDDKQAPELKEIASSLEHAKWPAVPTTGLLFDATNYIARVTTGTEEVRIQARGHGSRRVTRDSPALVRWAEDAYQRLQGRCQ